MYELFPVAALLGTLFALAQMVAHSEYTVMRVSGVSARAMIFTVLPLGIAFAGITFLIGEFVAPFSESAAQRILLKATNTGVVAQEFRSGLWVKDFNSFVKRDPGEHRCRTDRCADLRVRRPASPQVHQ